MSKWRLIALTTSALILLLLLALPHDYDYLQANEGARLWSKIEKEINAAITKDIEVDIVNQDLTSLTETVFEIATTTLSYNPNSNSRIIIIAKQNTFRSELRVSFESKVFEKWTPKKVFTSSTASIGWWSLLPLFIILFSLSIFGKIHFSLMISLFAGGLILSNGNPITAITKGLFLHIIYPLSVQFNLLLLLSIVLITGLFSIMLRLGGIEALLRFLPFVNSRRSIQFFSISFSTLLFFNEHIRTLVVTPIVQPFIKRSKISAEKIAFLVNSFAAPLASVLIFTTWFFFQFEILFNFAEVFGQKIDALDLLIRSMPYRFYGIGIIFFSILLIVTGKEFGPMLYNEEKFFKDRALEGVENDPIKPVSNLYLFLPLGVLIAFIFFASLYFSGLLNLLIGRKISLFPSAIASILSGTPVAVVLFVAIAFATIATLIAIYKRKDLSLDETVTYWRIGVSGSIKYILLLILAWGVASQVRELGSGDYLISLLNENLSIWILPLFIIFISSTLAFTTGSALLSMSIAMPLILPFVFEKGDLTALLISLAAITDGAVLGQQLSPIAETSILTSLGTKVSHIKYLRLSIPYALSVVGIALFSGYVLALLGLKPYMALIVMFILLYGLVRYIGKVPREAP